MKATRSEKVMRNVSNSAERPIPQLRWETTRKMEGTFPAARARHVQEYVDGKIYVMAGRPPSDKGKLNEEPFEDIWIFDVATFTWNHIKAPLPDGSKGDHYSHVSVVLGKKIIVVIDGSRMFTFDTETLTWSSNQMTGSLPTYESESWTVCNDKMIGYGRRVHCLNLATNCVELIGNRGDDPFDRSRVDVYTIGDKIAMLSQDLHIIDPDTWVFALTNIKGGHLPLAFGPGRARFGNFILFVNEEWEEKKIKSGRLLDLITNRWHHVPIEGECPDHLTGCKSNQIGDKLFMMGWDHTNQMHVLTVSNLPTPEQNAEFEAAFQKDVMELCPIPPPKVVIKDLFSNQDIIIDSSLKKCDWNDTKIHREIATDMRSLFRKTSITGTDDIFHSTVPAQVEQGKILLHKSMMHYLTLCYNNHFSAVISPDMVFYTILAELAEEIKENPDSFKSVFVKRGAETHIVGVSEDVKNVNLPSLIAGIQANSPVDVQDFTAKFTSSTEESVLAMNAAFCDAMSAFFTYGTTMCGIPRVKLLGTAEDWTMLEQKLENWITKYFAGMDVCSYLSRAKKIIHKMTTNRSPEFWKGMFNINRCSSGHTDVAEGWIINIWRKCGKNKFRGKTTFSGDDFYNYKSHISTVKWTQEEFQRKFELYTGLLYSVIKVPTDSDPEIDQNFPFLEPQFGHMIKKVKQGPLNDADWAAFLDSIRDEDRNFFEIYEKYTGRDISVVLTDDYKIGIFEKWANDVIQFSQLEKSQLESLQLEDSQLEKFMENAKSIRTSRLFDFLSYNATWQQKLQVAEILARVYSENKLAESYETPYIHDQESNQIFEILLKTLLGKFNLKVLNFDRPIPAELFPLVTTIVSDPACSVTHLSISNVDMSVAKAVSVLLEKKQLKALSIRSIAKEANLAEISSTIGNSLKDNVVELFSINPCLVNANFFGQMMNDTAVQTLIIEGNKSKFDVVPLCNWLQTCSALQTFVLPKAGISPAEGAQVMRSISENSKNPPLKNLEFFQCWWGSEFVPEFVKFLRKCRTLQRVRLEQMKIDTAGAVEILEATRVNRSLTYLNLKSNPINWDEVDSQLVISVMKENDGLQQMTLQYQPNEEKSKQVKAWIAANKDPKCFAFY